MGESADPLPSARGKRMEKRKREAAVQHVAKVLAFQHGRRLNDLHPTEWEKYVDDARALIDAYEDWRSLYG